MSEYKVQTQSLTENSGAKKPFSKAAIVSLVCGILSLLGFGLIGLFIVGIIAGLAALSKIKKSNGNLDGQALAILGLVLSWLSVAITVIFYLFFLSGVLFYMNSAPPHKSANINVNASVR